MKEVSAYEAMKLAAERLDGMSPEEPAAPAVQQIYVTAGMMAASANVAEAAGVQAWDKMPLPDWMFPKPERSFKEGDRVIFVGDGGHHTPEILAGQEGQINGRVLESAGESLHWVRMDPGGDSAPKVQLHAAQLRPVEGL